MKRTAVFIIFALAAMFGLSACAPESDIKKPQSAQGAQSAEEETLKTPTVTVLKASEAKAMMDESEAFILLDVRTEQEYREARIDGALLLPNDEINARAEEVLPDKTAQIFLYCRSGRRSAEAAKKLLALGYENLYDFGGIIDWPYDTVSG